MPHFAPAPANLGLSANRCRAITFRACRVQLHSSPARWRKWCASAGALNATWWRRAQLAANTSNQFWARIPATSYIGPKISRNPLLAGPFLSGRRLPIFLLQKTLLKQNMKPAYPYGVEKLVNQIRDLLLIPIETKLSSKCRI